MSIASKMLQFPLLFEISGNMFIVILCFPACDAINFKIYLSFPVKPFFYITKKSGKNFKYLRKENSFSDDIKTFIIFKGFSSN